MAASPRGEPAGSLTATHRRVSEASHLRMETVVESKSDVALGAGVPVRHPAGRGRHGVAGASIGLQNWLATFGACRCGPKAAGPQTAIGVAMGRAGGDALRLSTGNELTCSTKTSCFTI
jgi:hypothetical protein